MHRHVLPGVECADRARPPRARKPCARREIGAGAGGAGPLILGAILAGGQARRFGADKALADWRGRPLIAYAADMLRPLVDEVVVCGREWGGLPSVADLPAPGLGPLGGLAGALNYASLSGFAEVLSVGCDMPELPSDLLERLVLRAPSYCVDAPVIGFWPASLAATLLAHIDAHDRSMRGWAHAAGALPIEAGAPLRNVNTPSDLLTA